MKAIAWPCSRSTAEPVAVLPVTDGGPRGRPSPSAPTSPGVGAREMDRLFKGAEAEAARAFVIEAPATGPPTLSVRTAKEAAGRERLAARVNLHRGGEPVPLAGPPIDENPRRTAVRARPVARVIAPDRRETGGETRRTGLGTWKGART